MNAPGGDTHPKSEAPTNRHLGFVKTATLQYEERDSRSLTGSRSYRLFSAVEDLSGWEWGVPLRDMKDTLFEGEPALRFSGTLRSNGGTSGVTVLIFIGPLNMIHNGLRNECPRRLQLHS